jgi:prepilin-type N-terminal cleavage/methylation domain-containing protein
MRQAFTLIELLVVISIIALLIAILLPVLTSARESAKTSQCLVNQRQLVVATHAYMTDNDGISMPGGVDPVDGSVAIKSVFWSRVSGFAASLAWPNQPDTRFGFYRRFGPIFSESYSEEPLILYCPKQQEAHPWQKPGGVYPVLPANGGFFYEGQQPGNLTRMYGSYYYRDTYLGAKYEAGQNYTNQVASLDQTLSLERDPSDLVLSADKFARTQPPTPQWPADRDAGHPNGYNFVRLDGSGEFFGDDSDVIFNMNNGSEYMSIFHGGIISAFRLEQAFETMRYGVKVGNDLVKP